MQDCHEQVLRGRNLTGKTERITVTSLIKKNITGLLHSILKIRRDYSLTTTKYGELKCRIFRSRHEVKESPTSGFRSRSDYFYSAFLHKFPLYDKDILQIHRISGFIRLRLFLSRSICCAIFNMKLANNFSESLVNKKEVQ